MLNTEMKDDQTCIFRLPDADADAFRLYSKWLYTGRFHVTAGEDFQILDNAQKDLHWDDLSACYALAGSLQSLDFADATMDAFIRRIIGDGDAPDELAKWVYPKATKDSIHRRLCRDIVVHSWARSNFDQIWTDGYPQDFIRDVFTYASSRLDSGVKRKNIASFLEMKGACDYHEHKRLGLPCYKTSFGY
jgi:hypothetical protein